MRWSPQQDTALRRVKEWYLQSSSQQVFYLGGYAGTGKTTLAVHFSEDVDGDVLFSAPTGKSAYVMRQKGCHNASTIHSRLYTSKEASKEKLRRLEADLADLRLHLNQTQGLSGESIDAHPQVRRMEEEIETEQDNLKRPHFTLNMDSPYKDASLIIVDEVSMVDEVVGKDLLSFGKKILVLGDPFQLPPVFGQGFFTAGDPDFTLTEIHRQAAESPVLYLATRVREGESIYVGRYGQSRITTDRISPEEAVQAEQILVGRNATRRASNARVRTLLGRTSIYPQKDDRLICLRNNHDRGLLNGGIWRAEADAVKVDDNFLGMEIRGDDDVFQQITAHTSHFERRDIPFYQRIDAEEFDYGYAITTHKAQGSQYEHGIIFDESGAFRENARRHLYTSLTRFSDRVVLAR